MKNVTRFTVLGRPDLGVVTVDWESEENRLRRSYVWVTLANGEKTKLMKSSLRPVVE